MSTTHRPTWDPAQAREVKGVSLQSSVRDMAAHTKLKFRYRDLRADLLAAEAEPCAKMREAASLPVEDAPMAPEDEEAKKRRKVLQDALDMGKDADSDEGDGDGANHSKGNANGDRGGEEEDRGDDDEEDDTTELLRELEKIKRERAAEHARVEQAEAEATEAEREARIATANPLLNLSAALGNAPGINTTAPGTFALKRRWDDDLVFKNQAKGDKDKPQGQFVNDLFRTEFHKKSMSRFIK
ncbi:Cwf15/Cwc15 cell cycle control protein [Lactarius pseudohatsudake]|nr:Cwf15/Cwc15 cell cycle control protein [Lactarius pseudohatsudake]